MNIPAIPHPAFSKIPRLNRDMVISEKIDGTNGLIHVTETGEVCAGSRNRWITPKNDNYGFAKWVEANAAELQKLGPGNHYGEYWGQGIQSGYGLTEKRFSLFNTGRWKSVDSRNALLLSPGVTFKNEAPGVFSIEKEGDAPNVVQCCYVVPILYTGPFHQGAIKNELEKLSLTGSVAAPGYPCPEGIVVFHTASRQCYKVTIAGDKSPKSINEK